VAQYAFGRQLSHTLSDGIWKNQHFNVRCFVALSAAEAQMRADAEKDFVLQLGKVRAAFHSVYHSSCPL
jgi:hypothetical protein